MIRFSRKLLRTAAASVVVTAAALSKPPLAAASECASPCLIYCPGDPWSYCFGVYGQGSGTCGMLAHCESGNTSCLLGYGVILHCEDTNQQ